MIFVHIYTLYAGLQQILTGAQIYLLCKSIRIIGIANHNMTNKVWRLYNYLVNPCLFNVTNMRRNITYIIIKCKNYIF